MAMFNSKLLVHQRVNLHFPVVFLGFSYGFLWFSYRSHQSHLIFPQTLSCRILRIIPELQQTAALTESGSRPGFRTAFKARRAWDPTGAGDEGKDTSNKAYLDWLVVWYIHVLFFHISGIRHWFGTFFFSFFFPYMGMDQYLLIPFLGGWTSINPSYFWCELQGYKVLTHCQIGNNNPN